MLHLYVCISPTECEVEVGLLAWPLCCWPFLLFQLTNLTEIHDQISGMARCPYNPLHNSTALITSSGELYAATAMDFSGRDPAIYRSLGGLPPLRTAQYNSKWLNGKRGSKNLLAVAAMGHLHRSWWVFVPIILWYEGLATKKKDFLQLFCHLFLEKKKLEPELLSNCKIVVLSIFLCTFKRFSEINHSIKKKKSQARINPKKVVEPKAAGVRRAAIAILSAGDFYLIPF